ncbi:MAG TPA: hypothetical protein VFO41_00395, partial [Alphaproteobacteria bacterium]|nr:hypothetical protein [Alphaproteobacteria bacterium]
VAAIDAVTFQLISRCRPEAVRGIRVLADSDKAPGLPYVTRAGAGPSEIARLRRGIGAAFADPALVEVRRRLGLDGVAFLERRDYAPIAAMAARAAGLRRPDAVTEARQHRAATPAERQGGLAD